MKTILTLIVMLLAGTASATAQQEYRPLVEEGKRWDYTDVNGQPFSYIISGDTLLNGTVYKKVYELNGLSGVYACLRESDRRVYVVRGGQQSEELLYDFALARQGDAFAYSDGSTLQLTGSYAFLGSDGRLYRSEHVGIRHSDGSSCRPDVKPVWIEGVGSILYGLFQPNGWTDIMQTSRLEGCYLGDVCLLRPADLTGGPASPDLWTLPSRELVREGRRWNYRYASSPMSPPLFSSSQWIAGDTIVGGVGYKKLFEEDPVKHSNGAPCLIALLRQDGDDVFWREASTGQERLLMRQGMRQGATAEACLGSPAPQTLLVDSVTNVASCGHTFRVMTLSAADGAQAGGWVEGVGDAMCGLNLGTDGYSLLSCYDGDDCLYSAALLPAATAYKTVSSRADGSFVATVPLCTSAALSKSETLYRSGSDYKLCGGDLLTGVAFSGYNAGEAVRCHVTLRLEGDNKSRLTSQFTKTDLMTTVFDGDCIIRHGGTAETPERILEIPFSMPYAVGQAAVSLRMVVESSMAVPTTDSIRFAATHATAVNSLWATADGDGQLSIPRFAHMPAATFTVATPVKYVWGTVSDGQGNPVSGATVSLEANQWEHAVSQTATAIDGSYRLRIDDGNNVFRPTVSAPGHTVYTDEEPFAVSDNPRRSFTIYGSVTYPAGKRSTIILPFAPDATAGRYYRLACRNDKQFVFEREHQPKANTPYVFFADRDYHVSLEGENLTIAPGVTTIDDDLWLAGSYTNYDHTQVATHIFRVLDEETPATGTALHAQLWGHWSLLLNDDYELVFVDTPSGILQVERQAGTAALCDLQGRRVEGQPRRGLYIQQGRKRVVR